MLQIYIRPDLSWLLTPCGPGLYRLRVELRQPENDSADDGLNRDGLGSPGHWRQVSLLLQALVHGRYAIVSVDVDHGLPDH